MAGPDFLVAQRLYAGYGRVAAVTVPGAAASAGVSALVADTRRVRSLCVFAGLAIAATVAIWRFANEPVNREVVTWRADALPADWEQRRDQWEFAHAASAVLHGVGLAALLAAALRDEPGDEP
jgi:hypothetical protein